MKITVLGSGTSTPSKTRSSSGYWLETEGRRILLDCGPTVGFRMAEEGLDWPNLDAIWISHFHLDHAGGLAPFLFGAKWASEMKDRTKKMSIFGPKGLKDWFHQIDSAAE